LLIELRRDQTIVKEVDGLAVLQPTDPTAKEALEI
jgi:hypothetical protein